MSRDVGMKEQTRTEEHAQSEVTVGQASMSNVIASSTALKSLFVTCQGCKNQSFLKGLSHREFFSCQILFFRVFLKSLWFCSFEKKQLLVKA